MADYNGTMTEMVRHDTDGPSVVVSYWTNDEGEKYEPRVRFVLGERNRPVKGLTRAQALAVRDAFNTICDEWDTPAAVPTTKPKASTKSKSRGKSKSKTADVISLKAASEAAAADAIADMFKGK